MDSAREWAARRLEGHVPAAGADTAGVPWAGRELPASPFAGDIGEPDAPVRAALRALAELGSAPPPGLGADREPEAGPGRACGHRPAATQLGESPRVSAEGALLAALAEARLFVAIEAVPAGDGTEAVPAGDGTVAVPAGEMAAARRELAPGAALGDAGGDARSDMASPVLTAPDGRRGMPLFTGLDTLARWRPKARPVPLHASDAARAAIDDCCDVALLDLGSEEAQVLRLSQLWALAQERPWLPAHVDPLVGRALANSIAGRDAIVAATLADGSVHAPGVTRVVLTLREGLQRSDVKALISAVGESLAADPDVRIRIDDLVVVLREAGRVSGEMPR